MSIIDIRGKKQSKTYSKIHEQDITGIQSLNNNTVITNSLDGYIKILDG